jgi:transposase InsO family protein
MCGISNPAADQSSQTSSPKISRNPTNELTRRQISVLTRNRQRIWRSGSSIRPCAEASKQPLKAKIHSWPPPTKPLERIHIDFDRRKLVRQFLIVVDAWSMYADIISVSSTTSRQTVAILLELFAQHGVPEKIASDKGTQYTSHDFRELCKSDDLSHILSSHVPPQIKWTWSIAFSTLSSARFSTCERRKMWITSWIHPCWLRGRRLATLPDNNVNLLNSSLDVRPVQRWIFYFRPRNKQGVT